MAEAAGNIRVYGFDDKSFPPGLKVSSQVTYLRRYLAHLGVQGIIEEPSYFDRDYLAEFSTFYSTSARGYANRCRRLHLFKLPQEKLRTTFRNALAGRKRSLARLNREYSGFVVVRPLAVTPIGRTVLSLYPETRPGTPRVTEPARDYVAHLAGLRLVVSGLAWQQQDSAVGACATVAVWTALHSSALDDHHAIPTTVEVTRAANRKWFEGKREFPAHDGLSQYQMCEAISAQGLVPAVLQGDRVVRGHDGLVQGFERSRFASSIAALLRSGYPVLLSGLSVDASDFWTNKLSGTGHAVCVVGFRSAGPLSVPTNNSLIDDGNVEHLYIHDDNIGPNVRYEITTISCPDTTGLQDVVVLVPAAPRPDDVPPPAPIRSVIVPSCLIAPLPDEIRISPDDLHRRTAELSALLSLGVGAFAKSEKLNLPGTTCAARFIRTSDYFGSELGQRLSGPVLARVRTALASRAPPMSLHVGLTRIAIGRIPVLDVLWDTTDNARAMDPFAHVKFSPAIQVVLDFLATVPDIVLPTGRCIGIDAF